MTNILCTPACWTPVPCPECGRELPPRGRAVPLEVFVAECCDENRYIDANRRHLWDESEAATWPR